MNPIIIGEKFTTTYNGVRIDFLCTGVNCQVSFHNVPDNFENSVIVVDFSKTKGETWEDILTRAKERLSEMMWNDAGKSWKDFSICVQLQFISHGTWKWRYMLYLPNGSYCSEPIFKSRNDAIGDAKEMASRILSSPED